MDNLGNIAGLVITNMVVWSLLGLLIKRSREKSIEKKNAKKQKKEQEQKAEELKRQTEKEIEEIRRQEEEEKIYQEAYDLTKRTLALYLKKGEEIKWFMDNKINPILLDMPIKRLEDTKQDFTNNRRITELGPYKINREQIHSWYKDYLNAKSRKEYEDKLARKKANEKVIAKQKIEAEKERISNRAKAEKERKWQEYISKFKSYNKAQQKSELEWFKKKLANNFADNQDEKDLYVHELEMIMLEDKNE